MILSLSLSLSQSLFSFFPLLESKSKDKEFKENLGCTCRVYGEIFVLKPIGFLVKYHARTKIVKKQKGTN